MDRESAYQRRTQLLAFSPGKEQAAGVWETCLAPGWPQLRSRCSPRDSQESSPTPQFKSINSSVLSFLYSPTLTSIHDHWKNHPKGRAGIREDGGRCCGPRRLLQRGLAPRSKGKARTELRPARRQAPQTAAHQAPLSLGFSRQEHWSTLPFPSPMH